MGTPAIAKALDQQAKQVVYNVYSYYKNKKNDPNTHEHREDINIIAKTSEVTGLSRSTVTRIIHQGNTLKLKTGTANFHTKKKTKHVRKKRIEIDEFTEAIIRKKVIQFYTIKKEVPSVRKLNALLKAEKILTCSNEYLRQLLHKLGFTNSKNETHGMLMERPDISSQRLNYLLSIKQYRSQRRAIYYLNITKHWQCHNHNHDEAIEKFPSLIFLNTLGSFSNGDNVLMKFTSQNTCGEDYSFENFENYDWIKETILPNIDPSSVIVMNIPYCETIESVEQDEKPTMASTRAALQDWLKRHNIQFRETDLKSDLVRLINNQQKEKEYAIDNVLTENNHYVLYLPDNHPDVNPVLLAWEELKETTEKVTPDKLFSGLTRERWNKYLEIVKENENEYYENDMKLDAAVDSLLTVKREKEDTDDDDSNSGSDSGD